MTLYVHPSFFDLPTHDPTSLQFLAAARFVALEVRVVPTANPYGGPARQLPCFVVDEDEARAPLTEFDDFVEYLRVGHRDLLLDYELTAEQRSLCVAYASLTREKLLPALEQIFWTDDYIYGSLTRTVYAKTMRFPHYVFFLNRRRAAATRTLESVGKTTKELMRDATQTLNMLSAKLGDSKYIFGNKPCSLDALLFGYLAPLLKLPLANDRLQLHLASQPNLGIYVENVASIYLPLTDAQLKESLAARQALIADVERARVALDKQRSSDKARRAEKAKASDSSSQSVLLFAVASIGLSVAFAIHTGIIKLVPQQVD